MRNSTKTWSGKQGPIRETEGIPPKQRVSFTFENAGFYYFNTARPTH
jgi:hypothetical protein